MPNRAPLAPPAPASSVTLEQARALDAIARAGSYAKAARAIGKAHSAVVYAVKGLEDAVGAAVFDRSGYRAVLTPLGRRVLEHCQALLAADAELATLCRAARAGYEPTLAVVFDGLLPVGPILGAVRRVNEVSPETRVALFSEFLGEVEARTHREEADVALTVVPFGQGVGDERPLAPLPSLLVAAADHPLAALGDALAAADLEAHPFLTVRGSDQRLRMSTSALPKRAEFRLSDFHAKREALRLGMGWGWMPGYLVADDVARGALAVLPWGEERGRHEFRPVLHVRRGRAGGPAVEAFVAAVTGTGTARA
ncbi:MAG: LysR family transcriptional regulator [Myxococcales bacterium]|nr:LysR family transcriptional regulator [Myxococcales bacterium]MCB9736550.1 LysR family transcriptional regulator [Deltaproteobacteria bacterium]